MIEEKTLVCCRYEMNWKHLYYVSSISIKATFRAFYELHLFICLPMYLVCLQNITQLHIKVPNLISCFDEMSLILKKMSNGSGWWLLSKYTWGQMAKSRWYHHNHKRSPFFPSLFFRGLSVFLASRPPGRYIPLE